MSHRRPRRLQAILPATLVLALALTAACSRPTPAAPPSSAPTIASAEASDPDTTPLAPATGTTPPSTTTTFSEDEAAVREVHTRFMTELAAIDERVAGPESRIPLIEQLTTGAQEARMKDAIAARLESGERLVSPGYISNILTVDIDDDHAEVRDCSLDQGELYSADEDLLVPAAGSYEIRVIMTVRIGGIWYVEDALAGGNEPCSPDDAG